MASELATGLIGAGLLYGPARGMLATFGQLLRDRRLQAHLSRAELARLAGLSEGTLKNLENGRRPPTRMVLTRLLAVTELGLQEELEEDMPGESPSLNCWLAPGFEPLKMLKDLVTQINSHGGHIEQSHLYLDHMSAANWCSIADQEDYAAVDLGMPLDRLAARIRECVGGAGIDVLGLGCGNGRSEVRMTQHLLGHADQGDLRLYLMDISQPLLGVAYKHAADSLADRRGVSVFAIQGNFHHLPRYTQLLYTPQRAHRRRVICMFGGTFGNLENEILFVRNSLVGFAPGDMLVLNYSHVYAPADQPTLVHMRDPRLMERVPAAWRQRYEEWLAGPIRRYCKDQINVEFSSHFDTAVCPVPGSYAIEVRARVRRQGGKVSDFTMFRFKRHDASKLEDAMRRLGWDVVDGWSYGEGGDRSFPRQLQIFRRRGGSV